MVLVEHKVTFQIFTTIFPNFLHILLIGDSVDRNAVVDWCEAYQGDLYAVNFDNHIRSDMISGRNSQFIFEFNTITKKNNIAVESLVCISSTFNYTVSFLFNKFGVFPQLWCTRQNHYNIAMGVDLLGSKALTNAYFERPQTYLHDNKIYDHQYFHSHVLFPAVDNLREVLNISTFNGVQLQSGLWDIAKYFKCYESLTPMPVFNDTVIEQWPKLFELHQYKFLLSFKIYFLSLRSKVVPSLQYRTINFINTQPNHVKKWYNKRGETILRKIRHISRKNAQLLKLHLFDWYRFQGSNILADGIHPQKESSILIAQYIVNQTTRWHYSRNISLA